MTNAEAIVAVAFMILAGWVIYLVLTSLQ